MANITVSSGQTSAATSGNTYTVQNGGTLNVSGAGVAISSTLVSSGGNESVFNGGSATNDMIYGRLVVSGGAISNETVESGGSATLNSGAVDSGMTVLAGGTLSVLGSTASGANPIALNGDQIYGVVNTISGGAAMFTSDTVFNGGTLNLSNSNNAVGTVVSKGGQVFLSGSEYSSNTTLVSGGKAVLDSPKATLSGSLTFSGGGNTLLLEGKLASAGYGVAATLSSFTSSDQVVVSGGSTDTVSVYTSNGVTTATVSSGGQIDYLTFSGAQYSTSTLAWTTLANGDDVLTFQSSGTTIVSTSTSSGAYTEGAGNTLVVLSGGSVTAPAIQSGGSLIVRGGVDSGAVVQSGGTETVSAGSASGDQISGSAVVSGGVVSSETVFSGGALSVAGGAVSNTVLSGAATLNLGAGQLGGSLTFDNGHNTFVVSGGATGDSAVVSGYSSNDKIEISGFGSSGATLSFSSGAGGTEVATVTSGGQSESFAFTNGATYNASTMSLAADGANVDLVLDTTPAIAFTTLNNLSTNQSTYTVNGTVNVNADPYAIGSTVMVTEGGQTVGTGVVGSNGFWHANVSLANTSGANTLSASVTDSASQTGTTATPLTLNANTSAPAFTAGNLVISISGDGDGSGSYGDNQASPMTLEQITTAGTIVSQIVAPETQTSTNGKTEYAVSSEYGSSSEGSLELSADGHSLTIAGYGVDDATFNAGGASVYGNAAEAQSTSVQGGQYTAVPRVIVDVNANGAADTSTALYNIYNVNNPRSVVTTNGSTFFISGQGDKNANGNVDQGVFNTTDGSSSANSLSSTSDTRTVEIYNGNVYFSVDSKQDTTSPLSGSGIYLLGSVASLQNATTTATPTILPGMTGSIMLTASNGNTVNDANGAGAGQTAYLSPENFFFANSTTLYIADGGAPKFGGVGDGGLQKWSLVNGTWQLDYTLSQGLNLINNNSGASATGDTGLIGLTGAVNNATGAVTLYATTEPLNDLGNTAVVTVTDQLTNTSSPTNESFSTVLNASPGENIRGIAFAPTPCFCTGSLILTARGEVRVEDLKVGDEVVTAENGLKPIVWIGRRQLNLLNHPEPKEVRPVRIRRDAFGLGLPRRDLWLSPRHCLTWDGALIPVGALVNGQSIAQIDVESTVYWHIELAAHDVIFAEGLATESYLDNGNRYAFENGGAFIEAHPTFKPKHWLDTCLPLESEGARVVAARARLLDRLTAKGVKTVDDADVHLVVDGRRIESMRLGGQRLAFLAPEGGGAASLRSRSFTPAQIEAASFDGRELGVCIARLQIDGEEVALDDVRLNGEGWNEAELEGGRAHRRWTKGDAALPAGARLIVLELGGQGRYWPEETAAVRLRIA